jgi:diguanylate cyclase
MLRILTCLGFQHDWRLIILAGIVCFLASLAAISMFQRARAAEGRARAIWTIATAASTGSGIWATHFIAMLAYDPGLALGYDIGRTVLSLIAATLVTGAGLAYAIYGATRLSPATGGAIVGGGVAAMHYLGMSAVVMPGTIAWSVDLVVASILLGMAFGAAALVVATRGDGVRPVLAGAALMALAILSHHFTAMGAVTVIADAARSIDPLSLAPTWLALGIAGVAIAVLGLSLAGAIADRHLADRAVEAAARFHGLAEATTEALIICDGGAIADVNSSLERLVGRRQAELVGKPLKSLFPVANAEISIGKAGEVVVAGANGELVACEVSSRTIPHGNRERIVVSLRDLRERKRAEARIIYLAMHDPLTDLPNRTAFNDRLTTVLDSARRNERGFALLCVDFDRFKEINDLFGHAAGDELLCEVGRRMREVAGNDFIARLGGDEFVLVSEGADPARAEDIATRLRAAVAGEIVIQGQRLRIGLSIGAAIFPGDGADAAELLANADAALYRAKSDGRSAIRFFSPEMDARLREKRALQADLRKALDANELVLYYQPQATVAGEIVGFEALARWMHPTRGIVLPATFIPVAEESGLIIELGEWVLREACREAASWPRPLKIAVNLSPVQFRHGDLPGLVHAILLETGLPARRLELEITEGVLIANFTRVVDILRRLKALGVGIAMDDFGTGYSSLSYLQSFPFDKIKIDRAFISNLDHNVQSETIVRAVIGLGRGLNLPVLAEGVENKHQLAFLSHERCSEVQGYLFGRPCAIEDYAAMVGRPAPDDRQPVIEMKRA